MIIADIYSDKLSEGLGLCPKNLQGTCPLTHYRALPEPVLAGRQEKGAVAPFLLDRIIRELLSIEPWNTGAGGFADCEDMPRKSIDIKLTDNPIQQKRGNCTLFLPSGEDGFGQSPIMGQGTSPLQVLRAEP